MKTNIIKTIEGGNSREAAIIRLQNAGYSAEAAYGGVAVKGEGWEAFFADSGQDSNTYTGRVPSQVDDLAVWDDATTRNGEQ